MAPFGGFLGPFSPKYGSSLLQFRPAVVSHKTKTVSEHSFKIKCLSGNRTYPKLTNLVHFWAQFTPGKPKILPKTKVFPETTSWNGLFKVKNRPEIKNQEVRSQDSTTFSEAPNSGLTVSENIFAAVRLKLALFQF